MRGCDVSSFPVNHEQRNPTQRLNSSVSTLKSKLLLGALALGLLASAGIGTLSAGEATAVSTSHASTPGRHLA